MLIVVPKFGEGTGLGEALTVSNHLEAEAGQDMESIFG